MRTTYSKLWWGIAATLIAGLIGSNIANINNAPKDIELCKQRIEYIAEDQKNHKDENKKDAQEVARKLEDMYKLMIDIYKIINTKGKQ